MVRNGPPVFTPDTSSLVTVGQVNEYLNELAVWKLENKGPGLAHHSYLVDEMIEPTIHLMNCRVTEYSHLLRHVVRIELRSGKYRDAITISMYGARLRDMATNAGWNLVATTFTEDLIIDVYFEKP